MRFLRPLSLAPSACRGASGASVRIRRQAALPLLGFALLFGSIGTLAGAASDPIAPRKACIAVVRDGRSAPLEAFDALVRRELLSMTEGRASLAFRDFDGAWNDGQTGNALRAALADSSVDAVIVLGPRSALSAASPALPLSKPVFGALLHDPALLPLPVGTEGLSAKPGFEVAELPFPAADLLARLRDLVPAESLAVVLDPVLAPDTEAAERWRAALSRAIGSPVTLVEAGSSADAVLKALPPDTRTVLLMPLERMAPAERTSLLRQLAARRVAALSYTGQAEVRDGALAGVLADSDLALARRLANNVDQFLAGAPAADLPLRVPARTAAYFNEAVAAEIGLATNTGALDEATLVEPGAPSGGTPLTLTDAVTRALASNFQYQARRAGTQASREDVRGAGSQLLPQLSAVSQWQRIDHDRALASGGLFPAAQLFAGVAASQTLFDDEAWARLRAAREAFSAASLAERAQRMDTAAEAIQAYLRLVSARAALRVAAENARVTGKNLELARLRRSVGTSGPEDILRFESLAAQQRSELIASRAQVDRARVALNRVLGADVEARWSPGDVGIDDPAFRVSAGRLAALVTDSHRFDRFRSCLTRFALDHSPDLEAGAAGLRAQRTLLAAKQRRALAPKVALTANFGRMVEQDFGGPTFPEQLASAGLPVHAAPLDRTVWTVGVQASLPLFTSGALRADNRRTRAQLRQMELTLDGAREAVAAATQAGLSAIESSYASIALSRKAADLAAQNLSVAQRKYEEGSVSLVTLLDAQNAAYAARQASELAVYRFLSDVTALERTVGWMELLVSPEENEAWVREISSAIDRKTQP